ncbi:MAG: tetratricopeptide repeat protein, partial [Candidatus Delongbacteria bacterium]|nr:tetratricopeptide repeat protein [Candidatus Delongbacteria bacterium]
MYAKEEGVRNAARLYSVNKETVCRWMRLDIEKKPVVISETTDVSADEDIYIFFHVLAHTVKNNEEYTLYQFNVTNESDTFKSIGFTASKYNTNLCVFLDYVLSTLRELNRFNIKKIKTNITGLSQSGKNTIYNSMIKQKFDVDLEIIDSKFITAKSLKINLHHKPKIKDMFTQAYRKLISESEIESLSNGIIIPPIFIDDFIQDYDKIISFSNYWNILNLPQKQSGILFQVMNEVEKMGDSAKIEFEFDKAMDFYHRLYLTSLNCENTNELQANILLKQAEIHYHLDSFDTSTKMLSNSIEIADKFNFPEKSAKAQFYLGMINYVLAKTDKADSFFIMAIENYEKSGNCKSSFDYYQARIRRNMNLSNFDAALEDINEFIERVVSENDKTALAKGFGIKGSIFYLKQLYDKAEECYLEQYKIAKENNDYNELSISLSNQLSLYTYQNNKELQFVNDLIEELKDISKIIKKN